MKKRKQNGGLLVSMVLIILFLSLLGTFIMTLEQNTLDLVVAEHDRLTRKPLRLQ